MFIPYLKTCLQNVKRHVYTFFEDMFTPYLKRCLYHVLEHVYTLFETYLDTFGDIFTLRLKACLHNVLRHNYIMVEYSFTPCLNTCYTNMFAQRRKTLYLFTLYFKAYLHYVWLCAYTMFQPYLHYIRRHVIKCLSTCLQHVDGGFFYEKNMKIRK